MSKRKLAKASKHAPKMARAQRNKQDIVRSPKDNSPRAVAAVSIEPPLQDDPRQAPVVVPPAGALTDLSQKKDSDPTQWLALTTANMPAYSSRLVEITQDNLQFACDFGLRLARIKSPIDFFAAMSELRSDGTTCSASTRKTWLDTRSGAPRRPESSRVHWLENRCSDKIAPMTTYGGPHPAYMQDCVSAWGLAHDRRGDVEKALRACAKHDVAVEINAHPWLLDLDWRWHQAALEFSCMLSINPDAHSIRELEHMHWDVEIALTQYIE